MGVWTNGIFDCISGSSGLIIACFCCPCQIAHQRAAVEEYECRCSDSILPCIFPFCCAISTRGKIREKYGIEGNCLGDSCLTLFCCACAINQQSQQLQMKGAMLMEK